MKSEPELQRLIEELAIQFEEKKKRAQELLVANSNLALQIKAEARQANKQVNSISSRRADELIATAKALAFQQEYQRKISSLLPGVVIQYRLHPNGSSSFPYVSEAIVEMYRVSPGKVHEDPGAIIEKIHPDDLAGVFACIQTSARNLTPWQHEYRVKFQDGTIRMHCCNALPQKEEDGSILWNGFITDVTELSQATEALRERENTFRTVADFAYDWEYWIEADGGYVYISPSCERITGYTREEFIADSFLLKKIIHPEDALFFHDHHERMQSLEHRHEVDEHEFRIVKKDGSVAHIEHLGRPVFTDNGNYRGCRVSNRDITARIKIKKDLELATAQLALAEKEKLDQSENRYRSIFQGSPDGIMISDAETKAIMFANPKQCVMFGYTEAELKSMTFAEIHPKDTFRDVLSEYEGLAQGKEILAKSIQCLKRNGEIFYSDISGSLIDIDKRKCIVGFFRDISDRRQVELSLKEALVRAEAANRLKTEFMKTISHEVRTPLNGILGFGNLLSDPGLSTEERQQYGVFMEASGSRLISTISDYMDVSLIASGNIEVNSNTVSIFTILSELKGNYQNICNVKKLDLHMSIPEGQEHCTVMTDGQLLRKIISCLLDNAIKFTEHGSISFGYSRNESDIEFFVADTGIGVSSDVYELIFDPFAQEDASSSRGYEGSGLGLYIIKSFLKLLGGELCLETVKGKGTEVSFTLPMERGFSEERNPSRRRSDRGLG
ncbi:MAG: PAS domain S-box protein [Spirochaetota bacterium]